MMSRGFGSTGFEVGEVIVMTGLVACDQEKAPGTQGGCVVGLVASSEVC